MEENKVFTPGPWRWIIHDHSTASLVGADEISDNVLDVSPCDNCQKDKTAWEWGRCTTPSEANAKLIASAPDLYAENLKLREALRQAESAAGYALMAMNTSGLPWNLDSTLEDAWQKLTESWKAINALLK